MLLNERPTVSHALRVSYMTASSVFSRLEEMESIPPAERLEHHEESLAMGLCELDSCTLRI